MVLRFAKSLSDLNGQVVHTSVIKITLLLGREEGLI